MEDLDDYIARNTKLLLYKSKFYFIWNKKLISILHNILSVFYALFMSVITLFFGVLYYYFMSYIKLYKLKKEIKKLKHSKDMSDQVHKAMNLEYDKKLQDEIDKIKNCIEIHNSNVFSTQSVVFCAIVTGYITLVISNISK